MAESMQVIACVTDCQCKECRAARRAHQERLKAMEDRVLTWSQVWTFRAGNSLVRLRTGILFKRPLRRGPKRWLARLAARWLGTLVEPIVLEHPQSRREAMEAIYAPGRN